MSVRLSTQQRTLAWYGNANGSDQLGNVYGPFSSPFAAGNTWQVVDAGQAQLPPYAPGALTDPTQTYLTPRPQLVDATGGGANAEANWQLLLPIDGSLVLGVLNNPANGLFGVTAQWLWSYFDGLLNNRAGANDSAAWATSIESSALPNPGHSGGGPGIQQTGSINITSGADPYLTLDPSQQLPNGAGTGIAGQAGGVNLLTGYIADGSATVLPFAGELRYSPLYLYPR